MFRKACELLLLSSLILAAFSPAQADDLNRELESRYANKVFVLRGFYSGFHLVYDASGMLSSYAQTGDWTSDGVVQVKEIHASRGKLSMRARRLLVSSKGSGFQFFRGSDQNESLNQKKWESLDIQAALPTTHPSLDQMVSLLARIFLTSQDRLADLVPEYWNPCVREGLEGKNVNCRFSPEIIAVPGIASRPTSSEPAAATESDSKPTGLQAESSIFPSELDTNGKYHIKPGITPPHQIYSPEPSFGEAARATKCQGTLTLALVVDTDGNPTNIRIVNPLGCGLDANAFLAVRTWRFAPAMKDGQAVRVPIQVQVDLRLY